MRPNLPAICLLLFAAACTESTVLEDQSGWTGTVAEEDGTTTVRTQSGSVWGGDAELVEELVIGTESRGEEDLFGEITGIAVAGDRILVLDRRWYAVRIFSSDGEPLEKFGREGGGPGEFRSPTALAVDPLTGNILVRESTNGRTHVLTGSGDYQLTLNPGFQGGWSGRMLMIRVTFDGTLYLVNRAYRRTSQGESGFVSTRQVFRIDDSGAVADTLDLPVYDHPDYELRAYVRNGEAYRPEDVPFGPQDVWSITHQGSIISGFAADYRIELARPGGAGMVIEREVEPIAVQAGERAWHKRAVESILRGFDPTWSWNGPAVPDNKPWFDEFVPDHSGRLWVLRRGEGHLAEGIDADQEADLRERGLFPAWTEERFFDVFDEQTGKFLGSVPCPEGVAVKPEPWIEGDVFIAAAYGPAGEPLLKRYRLVSPR